MCGAVFFLESADSQLFDATECFGCPRLPPQHSWREGGVSKRKNVSISKKEAEIRETPIIYRFP
jgi:hypothetical protein